MSEVPGVMRGPVGPARDVEGAMADLVRDGYCILPDALNDAQVSALRRRLEQQMRGERQRGLGYTYGGDAVRTSVSAAENDEGLNRWISMLANKGQVFVDLLGHARLNQLMTAFLGEGYLLSSYAAHVTAPGIPGRPVCHTDQWFVPAAYPRNSAHRPVGDIRRGEFSENTGEADKLITPPIVANVLWLLSDFTEESGGTRLLPGSHLSGEQPDPAAGDPPKSIGVTGKAGTAVVFDGRIWHGAGTNGSPHLRYALFTTFCGGMFRPLENYVLGTAPHVLAGASQELLERLGFKPWQTYGRIGENISQVISFDRDYVGEFAD